MKKLLLFMPAFLMILGICLVLADANSDHLKAAEELFETMHLDQTFQQTIEQLIDVRMQQDPLMVPYKDVMLRFLSKHMSYESMKDDMAKIYAEEFTINELKEITAFYKTPTGQKAALKMPVLTGKGARLGAQRVQENIHELQAMIAEEADRLRKE